MNTQQSIKETQRVPLPVFRVEGKKLDLGCGSKKLPGAFGVDCIKTGCADLQWDLEKRLPKRFWNSFELVFCAGIIEHIGNPLNFLSDCCLYAKPKGFVQIITDNADYWRFHKKGWPFGNYHSMAWYKESDLLKVQHKMMFQPGHVQNLFGMLDLQAVEMRYFWRQGIDYLLPKHLGSAYFSIVGQKKK